MSLGAYHFAKKKLGWKSNGLSNFPGNPFGNYRLPPDVVLFGTERKQFPYQFLNFPLSSPLLTQKNYGKSNCKWQAPSRLVGLPILEKLLQLFQRSFQPVYSDC